MSSIKFETDMKCKRALKEIKECSCSLSVFLERNISKLIVTDQSSSTSSSSVSEASNSEVTSQFIVARPAGVTNRELSVSFDVLQKGGCGIHIDTLKGIWQKAISLVTDSTMIAVVPGGATSSYNRMVASTSGSCSHLVTTPAKSCGQFKCDSKCLMFSTYKLCAHTIATAEVIGNSLNG